jgi:lipid II:glycine glycyltransferase (peptidoglycan interpeptide bridge formation enzyme)
MHLHAEHTSILDITPDTDTLLERMRQQTRYEVKRAPRRGINVRVESSPEALARFVAMQADTAVRQHFIPSSPMFLAALMQELGDHIAIYEACKDDIVLNSALIIMWGNEADYFEAASIPEARKEPGAYAILWHAIEAAKTRRIARFNFWGIAPGDNPRHRYAKVTTFKRGFGGDDVTYAQAHDFVIKPLGYTKNWLVESIRKRRRKLV